MLGLLATVVLALVALAVVALPSGTAAERRAEAELIRNDIIGAFASLGVATDDLVIDELDGSIETCRFYLPAPWQGTQTNIRVRTGAPIAQEDVVAAFGMTTNAGTTWVDIRGINADYTVAFRAGLSPTMTVSAQTGCLAE